jgi:hypothetical protein
MTAEQELAQIRHDQHVITDTLVQIASTLQVITDRARITAERGYTLERDDLVLRIDSVEVEDNSRGTVAKAKAYGVSMQQAEDEALASIQRIRARLGTINQLQVLAPTLLEALKTFIDDDQACDILPDQMGGFCATHHCGIPCRVEVARELIALAEGKKS